VTGIFFRETRFGRGAALPVWAFALAAVAAAVLLFFLLVLGAIFMTIAIPVAIVGLFVARWRLRQFLRSQARAGRAAPGDQPRVIEADYKVLGDD
jgi:hypothetical protein